MNQIVHQYQLLYSAYLSVGDITYHLSILAGCEKHSSPQNDLFFGSNFVMKLYSMHLLTVSLLVEGGYNP